MIFEQVGQEVVCRLSIEEAERALAEGYLSITPAEEGALSRAKRAAIRSAPLDITCDHKGGAEYHCAECCPGACDMHVTTPLRKPVDLDLMAALKESLARRSPR